MKKTLVILFVAGVLAACKSTDSNKSDYQYKDVPFTNVHFSDNFWAFICVQSNMPIHTRNTNFFIALIF